MEIAAVTAAMVKVGITAPCRKVVEMKLKIMLERPRPVMMKP